VRVDLRGSGDSDGILLDEYLPQEQDDALEVFAWLAEQPWCSGAVGMIGISWGGFNGLQAAARRPPALKAVISMCSTDDRYADDVHYVGGCVLGVDMLQWAATMLTLTAMPPDPVAVGEGWRSTWFERMERTPAMIEAWLSHQRRDDYWRQGSVCEDYTAITGIGSGVMDATLREHGLRIGELEAGPRGTIADVDGVRVGHVTLHRDEPDPPAGRGVARTGVTAILPRAPETLWVEPVPAGVAVLNGAGR
jgi:pimeloyl-ACP methyl ester carboxylesterase